MTIEAILSNFLPELLGAGAGAYFGYRYGIRQERQMRIEEEIELKRETIESLLEEMERNSVILGDESVLQFHRTPSTQVPFKVQPLTTSSYESAVASGRFSLISPINQIALSEYYEECRRIMRRISLVESTFRISNEEIQIYCKQINEIGKPLHDFIIEVQGHLKSEIQ